MADDLVSVVIPTYNDEEFLPRALDSIKIQTYDNIEVIVIDSGNSQAVKEIVSEYSLATYCTDPPRGPAAARNTGIDKASGEYIAFLDADDIWLPPKISKQLKRIEEECGDFIYSDQYITKETNSRIPSEQQKWTYQKAMEIPDDQPTYMKYFRHGGDPEGGIGSRTVLAHRKCFERYRFWEELKLHEDPNLWTRILSEFEAVRLEAPLAVKYNRNSSITADRKLRWQCEIMSILMLVNQYPELEAHANERLYEAKYQLSRNCIKSGDTKQARKYLFELGILNEAKKPDFRVVMILFISFLPIGQRKALAALKIIINDGFLGLLRSLSNN